MHQSQESVRRSRFVLAFIDSWSHRPSRTNSFVFVLLYYWDTRNDIAKKKWVLRSRLVSVVIDLWLHSPSKTNSFARVFVYHCESKEASLIEIGLAPSLPHIFKNTCFGPFLIIFSLIFITVYGLGGASADCVHWRVKMPRISVPLFPTFFCRY